MDTKVQDLEIKEGNLKLVARLIFQVKYVF